MRATGAVPSSSGVANASWAATMTAAAAASHQRRDIGAAAATTQVGRLTITVRASSTISGSNRVWGHDRQ